MELHTVLYIINATLLVLHEIESAYEKEWEILNLSGGVTGFILVHIPILLVLFYGVLQIDKQTLFGGWIGIITGFCGLIPFFVHKILFKRKDKFNLPISNILIYLNIATGIGLFMLSINLVRFF